MAAENGEDPGPSIDLGPITQLIRSVRNRIDEVLDLLNRVADRIAEGIKTALDALLPSIGEAIAGAVQAFAALADGLVSNIATPAELAAGLGAEIAARSPGAAKWLSEALGGAWEPFWVQVAAVIDKSLPGGIQGRLLSMFGDVPLPGAGVSLGELLGGLGQVNRLVTLLLALIVTAPQAFSTAYGPELEEVAQDNWLRKPVRVATPDQAFDAASRGVIDWSEAAELARRSGLRPDQVNIVAAPHQHRVGVAEVIALETRGLLARDEAVTALRRAGVPEWAAWRLLQAAQTPIGPSDVASLAGREAFEPDQVRDLQLDAELPADYLAVARQAGMPEHVARWYWYAHWTPMPLSYAYEALHRGFITPEQLNAVFRQQEVLPWVRDALVGISYDPLTRVDVRRAFDLGILDRAQVSKAYRDLGYDATNAEILTRFVVSLKEQADETDRQQQTAPIRTRTVEAYRDATISRADAEAALKGLGDDETSVSTLLAGADVDRVRRRADAVRDALARLYIEGYADESAIRTDLADAGIGPAEADELFAGWRVRRRYREAADYERSQRDLTKSEVLSAYKSRLASADDTGDLLRGLGYDEQETRALLGLADYQIAAATRSAAERATRALVLAGRLSPNAAADRLRGIPVPQARIDLLLEQWAVERDERTPDIALSVLEEGIREERLTVEQVRPELLRRGYTEAEADILLDVWEARVMVAERRIALQERALEQRASLQAQRLEAQERLQTARLAAALERQSRSAETTAIRDARRIEAEAARLERQIASQDAQLARRLEQTAAIEARQADLQERSLAARTESAQRSLAAQAERLERQIAARRELATQAEAARARLLEQQDALRQAAEQRAEERRLAGEQRAELRTIGKEERAYARKLTSQAVAAEQERALAEARTAALANIVQSLTNALGADLASLVARLTGLRGGAS